MHKLIDFVCDELEDIEQKAAKGELSIPDVQYADTLAHLKKNLLKSEEMMEVCLMPVAVDGMPSATAWVGTAPSAAIPGTAWKWPISSAI